MKNYLMAGVLGSLMILVSPAHAQTAERQEDYQLALSLAKEGQTDISGFIMSRDVSQLVGKDAAKDRAALKNAIETGRAKLLYHTVSDKSEGEAGRTGYFKQRFYSAVDNKGNETAMGAEILPIGLVAKWKRDGVGIHVDVLYAEEGPLSKVGSMKLPTYRHSSMSGTSVRIFDRPVVYRFSLPEGAKVGGNNFAVIVLSPKETQPLEALATGEYVGQYIRAASLETKRK